jgi:type I restriction enzyme S subunit
MNNEVVEWKTLGELTSLITKGTTPKKYTETGIAFIKTEAFDGSYINSKKYLSLMKIHIIKN